MPSSAVTIATTFLTSALLLSSLPKFSSRTSSPSALIEEVCGDSTICIQTLQSEPRVVAAKDLLSISIAIIEAGIANATNTRFYVQKLLNQTGLDADYEYVLRHCDSGYEHFGWSFRSALGEVQGNEFETATYDLKIGYTDNIDECRNAQSSKDVKNVAISKGNDFIYVFGTVACNAVDRLSSDSTM